MAYIGRGTDTISNVEVLDNLTFDGSASYTLQKSSVNFVPSSANNLLISISGVVQQGNFSVSGSTITFDTTVSASDTCDWILHYGTGLITTVADGAITEAKLGSNAVTTAKINDSAVTTAKLNDASVSLAKLTATGTKDATTFLRGDNTFATVPTGISNVNTVVIETTSTYTPTSGTLFFKVYVTGAGGGGGGLETTGTQTMTSGGGMGGNTTVKVFDSTEMGANASVTIGSGGAGSATYQNGSNGGNTTFNPAGTGSTLTGYGGRGGVGVRFQNNAGGLQQTFYVNTGLGNGDYVIYGGFGEAGHIGNAQSNDLYYQGGAGGKSFFGVGARRVGDDTANVVNGLSDGTRGGGGGGAAIISSSSTASGGDGADGVVVIEEYA